MKRLFLMFAVLVGVAYVGCKEGDGDRCQVNSDCTSNQCNKAEGVCSAEDTSSEDAMGPPDAPPPESRTASPPLVSRQTESRIVEKLVTAHATPLVECTSTRDATPSLTSRPSSAPVWTISRSLTSVVGSKTETPRSALVTSTGRGEPAWPCRSIPWPAATCSLPSA